MHPRSRSVQMEHRLKSFAPAWCRTFPTQPLSRMEVVELAVAGAPHQDATSGVRPTSGRALRLESPTSGAVQDLTGMTAQASCMLPTSDSDTTLVALRTRCSTT